MGLAGARLVDRAASSVDRRRPAVQKWHDHTVAVDFDDDLDRGARQRIGDCIAQQVAYRVDEETLIHAIDGGIPWAEVADLT